MKGLATIFIVLNLFVITHSAIGSEVLDFTSGTVTQHSWYQIPPEFGYPYGVLEYVEQGVTVTSLNATNGFPCFFLSQGGLNIAMESGPVEFSMGGLPFDLVSLDADWLGTEDPNIGPYTFTSSKNGSISGSIDVNANGTFLFPANAQWHGITSFTWTPHQYGWIDNVTINAVPEPSTLVLLLIASISLFAIRRK